MAKPSHSSTPTRVPLSRERVLEAGLRLADEAGIESLTMRKLAGALGVEAMSLYNHVANKGDLVDGMVDLVVGEIALPSGAEAWDVAVRECAVSAHDVLLRHPWACSLVISGTTNSEPRSARLRYMEWLLGRLRNAGFSPALTYHAYHTLDSYILGFTFWELGHSAAAQSFAGEKSFADVAAEFIREIRADFPYLAEHAEQHFDPPDDGRSEFEFGLDLILDGLKRAAGAA